MNSEEQTLIDGLFSRLQQAEKDSAPRDALAEARIKEHLTRQPAAPYYMTQSILVQEHAIKSRTSNSRPRSSNFRLNCSRPAPRARHRQRAAAGSCRASSVVAIASRPRPPRRAVPAAVGVNLRDRPLMRRRLSRTTTRSPTTHRNRPLRQRRSVVGSSVAR